MLETEHPHHAVKTHRDVCSEFNRLYVYMSSGDTGILDNDMQGFFILNNHAETDSEDFRLKFCPFCGQALI